MNTNKNIIIVIVIAAVLLGGYFLLRGPQQSSAPNTPSQGTTPVPITDVPAAETPVQGLVVTYTDAGYSPSPLQIKVGDTVTFQNNSTQSMWTASAMHPAHSIYSGTSLSEHCGNSTATTAFDTCESTVPGNLWSFKFDKVGTWKYHNHLNPAHFGAIVVE